MAGVWLDSSDTQVVIAWERDLNKEVLLRGPAFDPANGFSGKESNKLIQIKDQLTDGPGATIRMKLRYALEGIGRAGDEPLKGHGEGYKTALMSVEVNTLRHMVETSSPMVDQYVPEDSLEEGKDGLADWFADRFNFALNLHATGFDAVTKDAFRLNNAITAFPSDYIIRPNGKTSAANLTSDDIFDLNVLNLAARRLKLLRPLIRPIKTPLGDIYPVFLSPEQVHDLRRDDSVWFATMQNALKGGFLKDNPLFVNALGASQGFVFFEDPYVPPGLTSGEIQDNTRRAWIGGAQHINLAFGRGRAPKGYGLNRFKWDRESEDFGHIGQIAATTIVGMKASGYLKPGQAVTRPNGIVIETYAAHGLTASDVYEPWTRAGVDIAS